MDIKTINSTLFINAPSLSRIFEVNVPCNEKVGDLLIRILKGIGIEEYQFWGFYVLDDGITSVANNEEASIFFLKNYSNVWLMDSEFVPVTIYFDGLSRNFAFMANSKLKDLIKCATMVFGISTEEERLFLLNPIDQTIESLDVSTVAPCYILKVFGKNYLYNIFKPAALPDKSNLSIMLLSKMIMSKEIKNFFTTTRTRRNECSLVPLDQNRIEVLLKLFKNDSGISEVSPSDQMTFLFMVLIRNSSPIISERLHRIVLEHFHSNQDENLFRMAQAIVSLLPLSSHLILLELILCFNDYNSYLGSNDLDQITQLFHKLLFKNTQDLQAETAFIKFIIVFAPWVFKLGPQSCHSKELRISNGKLYIFDKKTGVVIAYSHNGVVPIDESYPKYTFDPIMITSCLKDSVIHEQMNKIDLSRQVRNINEEFQELMNLEDVFNSLIKESC